MADDVYVASAIEALGQSNVVKGWFPEKTVSSVAWSPAGDTSRWPRWTGASCSSTRRPPGNSERWARCTRAAWARSIGTPSPMLDEWVG